MATPLMNRAADTHGALIRHVLRAKLRDILRAAGAIRRDASAAIA